MLTTRNPQLTAWAPLLVCAYPVIEVLYSVWRRWLQKASAGAPDSLHLHSLIKTQIVMQHLPHWPARLRNAAVAPLLWPFAALPAAIAVAMPVAPVLHHLAALAACTLLYHLCYQRLLRRARRNPAPSPAPASDASGPAP